MSCSVWVFWGGELVFLDRSLGGKARTTTDTAVVRIQGMEETREMAGMWKLWDVEGVPERCFFV